MASGVKLTMPNGMVLEIPVSGCLAMAGESGCQSWPKPLTNYAVDSWHTKDQPAAATVPPYPAPSGWTIALEVDRLTVALAEFLAKLAQKPTPLNQTQINAKTGAQGLQPFLMQSDIYLP